MIVYVTGMTAKNLSSTVSMAKMGHLSMCYCCCFFKIMCLNMFVITACFLSVLWVKIWVNILKTIVICFQRHLVIHSVLTCLEMFYFSTKNAQL